MNKRWFVLSLIAASMLLFIAACAGPQQQTASTQPAAPQPPKIVKGGTFTDYLTGDAATLQPLLSQDTSSGLFIGMVYGSLTRTDPETLKTIGNLYEPEPELSADGKTMTWRLRKGLEWSDGTPITSKDVIFTWQKMMDDKVKFAYRTIYRDAYSDLSAPDDYTVVYTLGKANFCPAIDLSGMRGLIPKHIFEKVDINLNDFNNKPPVSSGLFSFKEWAKDDHASFNPSNPKFVRGEPHLDNYVVRVVKDSTLATQLFKTQEIDTITPDPVDWDEVAKLPHAQAFRYYLPNAGYTYLGFNLRNPILADRKVRQAIAYAINKQEFIDKVRLGFAKPQHSAFTATSWVYTDNVPKFEYSPDKARQMLKEAGFTPGANGMFQKDGKPLRIRFFYNSGNKQREQIAIIMQQYMKDVGVEMEVNVNEWNAFLDRLYKTRDFDMFVSGFSPGIEPNGTSNQWRSDGGQNASSYSNPEIEKLFEQGANVPGCKLEDRKPYYDKIQQILAEDQAYIYLFSQESLVVYTKRIKVNPVTKLGVGYQVEQWSALPQDSPK